MVEGWIEEGCFVWRGVVSRAFWVWLCDQVIFYAFDLRGYGSAGSQERSEGKELKGGSSYYEEYVKPLLISRKHEYH